MKTLDEMRKKIDELDDKLLHVLHERLLIVEEVGKLKKKQSLPPLDPSRWKTVLESRLEKASKLGLHSEFIKKILDTIHEEALLIERE